MRPRRWPTTRCWSGVCGSGTRIFDPLHVMQVDLLHRFRDGDDDELVVRGIQLSINTIATGLRNSG